MTRTGLPPCLYGALWRRRQALLLPAALSGAVAPRTAASAARADAVDLLLVLAVDASGSIDADEFRLQRTLLSESPPEIDPGETRAVIDALLATPERLLADAERVGALSAARPGSVTLVEDGGSKYFEPAAVTVFPAAP